MLIVSDDSTTSPNFSSSSLSHETDSVSSLGSKSCKLCRKQLANEHFHNPKNTKLFSVCDICRKKKRDKYWRNKELLQQTVMDTRMSSRSRRVRLRKDSTASTDSKSRGRTSILTDSDTLSSQSQFSETVSVPPPQMDVNYLNSFPRSPGRLIIVPPEIYTFIRVYYNNPDYLRACLGDEYWAALCTPNALAAVDGKNVF